MHVSTASALKQNCTQHAMATSVLLETDPFERKGLPAGMSMIRCSLGIAYPQNATVSFLLSFQGLPTDSVYKLSCLMITVGVDFLH